MRRLAIVLMLAVTPGLLGGHAAHAAPLQVCPSGCTYTSIQAAIAAATDGAEIDIAAGTYHEPLTLGQTSLTLAGQGAGSTVLVGQVRGLPVPFEGTAVTLQATAAHPVAITLRGMTITTRGLGGGISNQGGTMTLDGVTVTQTESCDAAIVNAGTMTIKNSLVVNNGGLDVGGLINRGSMTIDGSTFSQNGPLWTAGLRSCGGKQDDDGAMVNEYGATLTLIHSTVTKNVGEAVDNFETMTVTDTTVAGNIPLDCEGVVCPGTTPAPRPPIAIPQIQVDGQRGSASLLLAFSNPQPGRGEILFGPGPGCNGLTETATQERGTGLTIHEVRVLGDDLHGGAGPVLPGSTIWYEVVILTGGGTLVDNNGGRCYSVTVPSA